MHTTPDLDLWHRSGIRRQVRLRHLKQALMMHLVSSYRTDSPEFILAFDFGHLNSILLPQSHGVTPSFGHGFSQPKVVFGAQSTVDEDTYRFPLRTYLSPGPAHASGDVILRRRQGTVAIACFAGSSMPAITVWIDCAAKHA
jgi:hypothetical protein